MNKYKNENYSALINTTRWQRLRAEKLHRDPLCERCKQRGIITAAEEVHHIIPVESGCMLPEMTRLAYDAANLMSLCHRCHEALHREMGKGRKDEAKRRAEAQLAAFRTKFCIREGTPATPARDAGQAPKC